MAILNIRAKVLFVILDKGGEPMLYKLLRWPFGVVIGLRQPVVMEMLHSEELRLKLFKYRMELIKFFHDEFKEALGSCRSLIEIYYVYEIYRGNQVYNPDDRILFIRSFMKKVCEYYVDNILGRNDLAVNVMALSRAWYSAETEIENYQLLF